MIEEKYFSKKRIIYLIIMFVATYVATTFICVKKNSNVDTVIALSFLNLLFFVLLIVGLILKRTRGDLSHTQVSYGKICFGYVVSLILASVMTFLPDFTKPVLVFALVIYYFSEQTLAVYVSLYLSMLVCFLSSLNFYEISSFLILCTGGIFLTTLIKEKKQQLWVCFCLMALNIVIPCIFYYLSYQEIELSVFVYNGISSLVICVLTLLCYIPIKTYVSNEEDAILDVIVMDNYSLVCDIKAFSKFEYDHAVRVSKLSRKCAIAAGADEKVCAAAGLYYRIGKMEGEPFVENGIKLAINHCFPERVIKILSEYNGKEAPISSVESAIVQMVNIVVTKIELLDKDTMSSGWNQNVVIYQTLNETSGKGLYDKSQLTMNQFLRVRDVLATEEGLL